MSEAKTVFNRSKFKREGDFWNKKLSCEGHELGSIWREEMCMGMVCSLDSWREKAGRQPDAISRLEDHVSALFITDGGYVSFTIRKFRAVGLKSKIAECEAVIEKRSSQLKDLQKELAELRRYPRFNALYLRAFEKMLDVRRAKGLKTEWQTAQEVMDWWLAPSAKKPKDDGTCSIFGFGELAEEEEARAGK